MQFNKIQSDLQTKGYTHFNLKEYDTDLYNLLLPFKCNATDNLQSYMTRVRIDGELKRELNLGVPFQLKNEYEFRVSSFKEIL